MLTSAIRKRRLRRGIDDGQYYHDQPITSPRKPSGAMFQPQNKKPTDTELPNKWRTQPADHTDTNPSQLGDSQARPPAPTNRKDEIHCPMCGQPTLTYLNALEGDLPVDIRCTQCGSRFNTQQLLDAKMMEEISNVLQMNNMVSPISIPNPYFSQKSAVFKKDFDLSVKDYLGFDIGKSRYHAVNIADSRSYKDLLKRYLKEMPARKRELIRSILKNSLHGRDTISTVARKIADVTGDKAQAELIARTELSRLGNEGNIAHMEEQGVQKVEFVSAPEDGRLCEHCKRLDGTIMPIERSKGLLPIHCNCRCMVTDYYD